MKTIVKKVTTKKRTYIFFLHNSLISAKKVILFYKNSILLIILGKSLIFLVSIREIAIILSNYGKRYSVRVLRATL